MITTFKLQNSDRNGKFIKGQQFVSGTVIGWSNSHFTIEVTSYPDFKNPATPSVSTYTLERKRIRSQSNVPVHPTEPDKKW